MQQGRMLGAFMQGNLLILASSIVSSNPRSEVTGKGTLRARL